MKPKTPKEPSRHEFGKKGEQPQNVWKNYDWACSAMDDQFKWLWLSL